MRCAWLGLILAGAACHHGSAGTSGADASIDAADATSPDADLVKHDAPIDPDGLVGNFTYVKASNTDANDQFGTALALSADGKTLVVASANEASAAAGIDGAQADNSLPKSGAVYVFVQANGAWTQQAYLKASNPQEDAVFGSSLAISGDGNTIVVGSPAQRSCVPSSPPDFTCEGGPNSGGGSAGAAYVFTRVGMSWSQTGYLKASDANQLSLLSFAAAVAISGDGQTIAVGGPGDASTTSGIDSVPQLTDARGDNSGAVYLFGLSNGTWTQTHYIKASNAYGNAFFGGAIALSYDGAVMAVGAVGEDSPATGVNGNSSGHGVDDAGAAYTFVRTGNAWKETAYIKASNTAMFYRFATVLALSGDGATLAVGSWDESSDATGINGNDTDTSAMAAGAAYVFAFDGAQWSQQAYVKEQRTTTSDLFGSAVALSYDGNILAVGAPLESGGGTGVTTLQPTSDDLSNCGAVYVFKRTAAWAQLDYVKASNPDRGDSFGGETALSADGARLVVTAGGESSGATGIDGDQTDNSATNSGAVYIVE